MSATVGPSTAADLRLFHTSQGAHVFVADGSRIYDLDHATAQAIDLWLHGTSARDAVGLDAFERIVDPSARRWIGGTPAPPPALRSLSLNVAQSCNMTCHYCYADAGRFGGRRRMMEPAVGEAAVDRLIRESEPGSDLLLGFMGGEPLLNRALVHHAARYGAEAAARAGRRMGFSITTNATLMMPEDAQLFGELPFPAAAPPRLVSRAEAGATLQRSEAAIHEALSAIQVDLIESPRAERHRRIVVAQFAQMRNLVNGAAFSA